MSNRPCSRISCPDQAVATLTYVYADSMAVLGPLSATHEPHTYDLCDRHAQRTSAPKGWQVVRYKVMGDLFDGAGSGAEAVAARNSAPRISGPNA